MKYIFKSGFMGLGFLEDKEKLLNIVLSIRSVFGFGLRIITDVQQDNSILSRFAQSEIWTSNTLFRNVENKGFVRSVVWRVSRHPLPCGRPQKVLQKY